MAVDGPRGPKNAPTFLPGGAFEDWVDMGAVAEYAAEVGNHKVGTTAQRNALTGLNLWNGLTFEDTTLNATFRYNGAGWVPWSGVQLEDDATIVTRQVRFKILERVVNISADGRVGVPLPGVGFTKVLWGEGVNIDSGARPGMTLDVEQIDLTGITFHCYRAGASVPAGAARIRIMMIGY
jgi:hypothetical protein